MSREISIEELAENANNQSFGDDRLGVIFYNETVEDKERTLEEGRRCFKEREFIRIMVPGDRLNDVVRPVQRTGILPSDDRMRFAKKYAEFKAKGENKVAHDGTPLALWPVISAPFAEELKYLNIFTVEQLAELSDTYVGKIPMGHEWKRKAATFVAALKDNAQVVKIQAALDERDNEIETLKQAIKDQGEQIAALMKKGK